MSYAYATRKKDLKRVLVSESTRPIDTSKLRDRLIMRSEDFDEYTRIIITNEKQ
jgi:hypothetical protein